MLVTGVAGEMPAQGCWLPGLTWMAAVGAGCAARTVSIWPCLLAEVRVGAGDGEDMGIA